MSAPVGASLWESASLKISGNRSKLTTPSRTPAEKLRMKCSRSRNLSASIPPAKVAANAPSDRVIAFTALARLPSPGGPHFEAPPVTDVTVGHPGGQPHDDRCEDGRAQPGYME